MVKDDSTTTTNGGSIVKQALSGIILLLVTCTSAGAALLIRDLRTPGDALITFDTVTSLEWLDLTETRGRSYIDITGQLGPGGEFSGWRYATLVETQSMFGINFDPGAIVPVSPIESAAAAPVIAVFFSFFGIAESGDCLGTTPPGPCPRSQGRTGTSLGGGTHELVGFITIGGGARGSEIRQALPDSASGDSQFSNFLIRDDTDADGVNTECDNCPNVANSAQEDSDGDGMADDWEVWYFGRNNGQPNTGPAQNDADNDGYGNMCDADLNNSGTVTSADFAILRSVLSQSASSSPAAAADLNGSGTVTAADFAILRSRLNTAPGPSGLACAGTIPCQEPP